jgi:hypothetical protein
VGEIAFELDGEIAVLPMVDARDGLDICFRTSGSPKLEMALEHDRVTYEVDEWTRGPTYTSQPGLGVVLAARVLGEFGDDPHRYTTPRPARTTPAPPRSPCHQARRRSCSPATRATADSAMLCTNGRSVRCVGSPGARGYYQQLRTRGTGHQAALRQVANRLVGIGCLKAHTAYDEHTAWSHHLTGAA